VKATVDAIFQDGVFRPVESPELPNGERVRLTVERVRRASPEEILNLARQVYEGLSQKDIAEIEEMSRRRPLFADSET
jgi:predicted DNA-binding antitoxin AbrB/MazE fold protein